QVIPGVDEHLIARLLLNEVVINAGRLDVLALRGKLVGTPLKGRTGTEGKQRHQEKSNHGLRHGRPA
ncbi:hypothetical protein STIAU_8217, partial [Stigmatella aurantiaca DW4/3-1]